jgi:hypothetical protein
MEIDESGPLSSATFIATCSVGTSSGRIAALLFESGEHAITAFTAVVSGKREVVGLEIVPRSPGTALERSRAWAVATTAKLEALPDDWGAPLPSDWLRRGISVREVLRIYADHESGQAVVPDEWDLSTINANGDVAGITSEELGRLENLIDALAYVAALQEGRSPVAAIAERRCISPRTAEGRIRRARQMGFLTPAEGRRAGGELTSYARDLSGRLDRLSGVTERFRSDG